MKKLKLAVTYGVLLGHVIIRRRKLMSLGQGDLAKAAGIGQSSLSRIESGKAGFAIPLLLKVARGLKTRASTLTKEAEAAEEILAILGVTTFNGRVPQDSIWVEIEPKGVSSLLERAGKVLANK